MNITSIRNELEQRKGQKNQIVKTIDDLKKGCKKLEKQKENIQEAQDILQTVAKATQQELEYHISELVSLALEAVFPDPYRLNLDFELRRNKSEADLTFSKKDGEKMDPLTATGGGAVDVASFALRIALWSLQNPRSRKTIIFDEPFRFLSSDLQPKASLMLKELSEKLGLQFIIVTHEENLIDNADKVFTVTKKKGVSQVI